MVNQAFRSIFCNWIKGSQVLYGMPHFFFHLQHGKARLHDRLGADLPDAEAAWYHAYRNARDILTVGGRDRRQWGEHSLEVEDERGVHIWTMPLAEIAELVT